MAGMSRLPTCAPTIAHSGSGQTTHVEQSSPRISAQRHHAPQPRQGEHLQLQAVLAAGLLGRTPESGRRALRTTLPAGQDNYGELC